MPGDPDRDDARRRRRAVVVAGHRGEPAVAAGHLHDPDAAVRAAALSAVHRCGALEDRVLADALADPDHTVRRAAALVAARHPGAADRLSELLDDPDHTVAEAAAFALGERPPSAEVARLLGRMAVEHPDALCREAAVASLGAHGRPESLPAVLEACGDRASVRRRAVLALSAFEGPAVDSMLQQLAHDRDLQVRQAAEDQLGSPGPGAA